MKANRKIEHARPVFRSLVLFLATAMVAAGCTPTPIHYDPPAKTGWTPDGCRAVQSDAPALGAPVSFFRGLHADTVNSDEVAISLAPVLAYEWTAEPNFYVAEGPTFDNEGNLYISPLFPGEPVVLASLDPATGARRWAVSGTTLYGGGAPLVLNDPASPGNQIIYLGLYDRAIAVRPDGTIVWDVPTGLPAPPPISEDVGFYHCFGLNYQVQADALVGVTGDGHVYVLDRATGSRLLGTPYVIPGELPPPAPPSSLPDNVIQTADDALRHLFGALPPDAHPLKAITDILLGFGTKVANYFAIDPHTGRMFVAATAPDGEDGTVDGVSKYGALYCLELVTSGGPPCTIQERFHTSFEGGSASSPAMNADGTRIYVGDNIGNLIAVDAATGNKVWHINVGAQIFGSIGISSDGSELYASNKDAVIKIMDQGDTGVEVWRTAPEGYDAPGTEVNFNLNLATIGANQIFVHSGAGLLLNDYPMPFKVGIGALDRQTGQVRYFADGREETVSAISVGPDGGVYLGHSPLRRAVAWALFGQTGWTEPVTGGVGKYGPKRLDLLIRDAVCAGAARARNAFANAGTCPDSAAVDIRQIQALIDQSRRSSSKAIADGDLSAEDWAAIEGYLTTAEANLSSGTLDTAAGALDQACSLFP